MWQSFNSKLVRLKVGLIKAVDKFDPERFQFQTGSIKSWTTDNA